MKHKLLLAFLTLLCALPSSAFEYEYAGTTLQYSIVNEGKGTCYVSKCDYRTTSGTVVIPSSVVYDGVTYTVVSIGRYAFENCHDITSVVIPNTIASIDYCAFTFCTNLTSVTIPNSVTSIGVSAFEYCYKLITVTIPKSVTEIGERAFRSCENLSWITIPNSVTTIGNDAFSGCKLISITIPNSVTYIGFNAFACDRLISVDIPASVTYIGAGAFNSNWGVLKEVNYDTTEPLSLSSANIFNTETYEKATLNIARGGLENARNTEPWSKFKDIRESDFTTEEKTPQMVIVKLPGGNLRLAEEHAGTTVQLMADEGFEFHSATLGDEDVSHLVGEQGHFTVPAVEKPTVLNVVFKQIEKPETAINAASLDDEVCVAVHGKRVCISGKDAGTAVRAYDLRGALLEETTDSDFTLDHSGVIILRVGSATFKFAI